MEPPGRTHRGGHPAPAARTGVGGESAVCPPPPRCSPYRDPAIGLLAAHSACMTSQRTPGAAQPRCDVTGACGEVRGDAERQQSKAKRSGAKQNKPNASCPPCAPKLPRRLLAAAPGVEGGQTAQPCRAPVINGTDTRAGTRGTANDIGNFLIGGTTPRHQIQSLSLPSLEKKRKKNK